MDLNVGGAAEGDLRVTNPKVVVHQKGVVAVVAGSAVMRFQTEILG